ncbi:MAG TPA: NAD(P)-binding domain-containing protein, partial [Candidatus Latescibacteria bacterium]|nr:NAD(P)-binding domain-containing protein [Candidatus Latescibacterota bacterium]
MNAAVIGGGSWGSAFARHLGTIGIPTRLWIREEDILQEALRSGENTVFLPGFAFPKAVGFSNDLRQTVAFADVVFIAVPSQFCRAVYGKITAVLRKDQIVVSLTKGFDKKT